MDSSNETQAPSEATPEARRSGVGKILRWAARLTSLPVLAMLALSLWPGIQNFSVAPRGDRIQTVALCGIGVGFLTGWRWAGLGGALSLISLGIVAAENDGSLFADPFALAFGLQGLLFLVAWAVNWERPAAGVVGSKWLKRILAGGLAAAVLAGAALILRGPGPTPVPKEKEAYVGLWDNGHGFTLEITTDGRARISEDQKAEIAACNTPVAPGQTADFLALFHSDDQLELTSGYLGASKVYHIDRHPFRQNKQLKLILNGSDPYVRTNRLVLVKKEPAPAGAHSGTSEKKS